MANNETACLQCCGPSRVQPDARVAVVADSGFDLAPGIRTPYRLAHDAHLLWNAFEKMHNRNGWPGELEIPMESFARAVEIMLEGCWDADAKH